MDSTLIDGGRASCIPYLPIAKAGGRAGESRHGGAGVGRYICKMDYVGFAEFNIDTDSS